MIDKGRRISMKPSRSAINLFASQLLLRNFKEGTRNPNQTQARKQVVKDIQEILSSIDRLSDHEIYLSRFAFASGRISRARYLKHHSNSYENELYSLAERLKCYWLHMATLYRKHPVVRTLNKEGRDIYYGFEKCVKPIIRKRGMQVHECDSPFQELEMLEGIELLINIGDRTWSRRYYECECKRQRRLFLTWITGMNKIVSLAAYGVVARITAVITDANGDVLDPSIVAQEAVDADQHK
jgi:hypothetical protein